MAHMMILNPSKRGKAKKKPSAAQLAARAKFAAAAKARAKAKRNPAKKRRKATKARRATVVKLNPGAPVMAKKARKKSARRRSPLNLFRRKARKNPIVPRGFADSHLKPAALGAAGALVNDLAAGFLVGKLPAVLQKQELRHIVKAGIAVGLSALAVKGKIANGPMVKAMTVGALTCTLHDASRAQVQKFLPSIALGEYLSEVVGPWPGTSAVGMGEYLSALPGSGSNYPDEYATDGSYAAQLTQ